MNARRALPMLTLILALGLPTSPLLAQEMGAEVRTWSGQSLRLGRASLEVLYTILPREGGAAASGAPAGYGGSGLGGGPTSQLSPAAGGVQVMGSLRSVKQLTAGGLEPIQGRRHVDYVNVYQGGVTHRVAVARIDSIVFRRQPVLDSTLPPYFVSEHFRSAATVLFLDGSKLEGDYFDPGTLLLRGMTADGRVEVPWGEIETLRFTR